MVSEGRRGGFRGNGGTQIGEVAAITGEVGGTAEGECEDEDEDDGEGAGSGEVGAAGDARCSFSPFRLPPPEEAFAFGFGVLN